MLFSIKNPANIIPTIRDTFLRFPLPFICALVSTLIALLLVRDINYVSSWSVLRLFSSLVYATIALTSLKLLVESKNWSLTRHLIGVVIITAVIVGYVWAVFVESTPSTYIYFSLAVGLSLLFSAYIKRSGDSASIWYFNYQNAVAVFFAGLSAVIFGLGLSFILVSVAYLFEIKISIEVYRDVWLLSGGSLFSIYILSNIAKEFDYDNESCAFPKGVSFITNYILVPLMFAYMFVLYAYFIKITVQWELPRGNLGWMITSFGTIGIITKLLVYPIRNSGTRLLALFDKYYYYTLIVPILLLAISIGVRINDYGVTEERYGVVLLGVWFSSVILLTFVKKDRFHIKYVPMILAVLAILASFGPWGAVEVSLSSQTSRLESLLTKHNLMLNGQAIKTKVELSFEDRKTLSSMTDYFTAERYRQKRIRPLFETLIAEALSKETDCCKYRYSLNHKDFIELLGLNYVYGGQSEDYANYINYEKNTHLNDRFHDVSGFDYAGTIFLSRDRKNRIEHEPHTYLISEHESITVELDHKFLIVRSESGDTAEFDLSGHMLELKKQGVGKIDSADYNTIESADYKKLSLTKNSVKGSFKARILLQRIRGEVIKGNAIYITEVEGVLMLKLTAPGTTNNAINDSDINPESNNKNTLKSKEPIFIDKPSHSNISELPDGMTLLNNLPDKIDNYSKFYIRMNDHPSQGTDIGYNYNEGNSRVQINIDDRERYSMRYGISDDLIKENFEWHIKTIYDLEKDGVLYKNVQEYERGELTLFDKRPALYLHMNYIRQDYDRQLNHYYITFSINGYLISISIADVEPLNKEAIINLTNKIIGLLDI